MTMFEENMEKYIDCYERLASDVLIKPLDTLYPARFSDLKSFIHDTNNDIVLDVGSSQGLFLETIDAKEKIAFDISHTFLKATKRKLNPIRGNAELLPFKDKTVDTIITSDILEHVFHPELVVKEVYRVLKDNGIFYLVVPWMEDISIYEKYNGKYDYCHLRSFDNNTILGLLDVGGFRGVDAKGSILKLPMVWHVLWRLPTLNKTLTFLTTKIESVTERTLIPYVHMMIKARKK